METFNGLKLKYVNESPSFTNGGGGWGEKLRIRGRLSRPRYSIKIQNQSLSSLELASSGTYCAH